MLKAIVYITLFFCDVDIEAVKKQISIVVGSYKDNDDLLYNIHFALSNNYASKLRFDDFYWGKLLNYSDISEYQLVMDKHTDFFVFDSKVLEQQYNWAKKLCEDSGIEFVLYFQRLEILKSSLSKKDIIQLPKIMILDNLAVLSFHLSNANFLGNLLRSRIHNEMVLCLHNFDDTFIEVLKIKLRLCHRKRLMESNYRIV